MTPPHPTRPDVDHADEEIHRYRIAALACADLIWDWQPCHGTSWWSERAQAITGRPADALAALGPGWVELIHPEDRQAFEAGLHGALEGAETVWRSEFRLLRPGGATVELELRAGILRNPLGQAIRVVGGMSDISDRKRAERLLAEQAELLNKARDAIIVRDLEGGIRFWSKGAERIYGWRAEEVLGLRIIPRIYQDIRQFEQASASVLRDGEFTGELMHLTREGRPLAIEAHWTLVTDDAGTPRAILGIHTDITRRRALEAQLRQSQRLEAIGQLTGGIAHDFNNLLTVIVGSAELLEAESPPDEAGTTHTLAGMIRTAAERGAELTHRLLAFSRRQALQPSAIDVNGTIAAMKSLLRRTLAEHIELAFDCSKPLELAFIDEAQLESAVLNLCLNARDAMPEGGRLTLGTHAIDIDETDDAERDPELRPGRYIALSVSDTGVGIPSSLLPRVFEPFFTTKSAGKGTGLGLSMVYGFIRQSGGQVRVVSAPDRGTTVTLLLPCARADDAGATMPELAPELPQADARPLDRSVLIVEDDELVRRHACSLVRELGYRTLNAANGQAALRLIESAEAIDLLFTDVVMPGGLSGPELARAARRVRPGLRVLFTSGYTDNMVEAGGSLEAGILLLHKPYRRDALARMLERALSADPQSPPAGS
jgi:PAS domain S-box-containing protein